MPSISIEQFNSLAKNAKADVVQNFAEYLLHYQNVKHLFALYQLDSFYVELVYDIRQNKRLVRIKSHASTATIQKYLLKIDLEELGLIS